MNQKHFEGIVGSFCGVFGGGFITLNVHWSSETNKFVLAMLTAFFAGGLGWIGQQTYKWVWNKRIKPFFKPKNKKDNGTNNANTSGEAD